MSLKEMWISFRTKLLCIELTSVNTKIIQSKLKRQRPNRTEVVTVEMDILAFNAINVLSQIANRQVMLVVYKSHVFV